MEPMIEQDVRETLVTVGGRPARVFVGGTGEPVVLVHGGWAGAAAHWSAVWSELATRHRVIAPDLPGVGDVTQPGLGSITAYARWLNDLLVVLGVERACFVGNSFGVAVISRFAFDFPERCRRLVFVNGFAMPKTPAFLQKLGERAFTVVEQQSPSRQPPFSCGARTIDCLARRSGPRASSRRRWAAQS